MRQQSGLFSQCIKDRDDVGLTLDQAKHILIKVEKDNVINVVTRLLEMEETRLDRENSNDEENPYEVMIINDFEKVN